MKFQIPKNENILPMFFQVVSVKTIAKNYYEWIENINSDNINSEN